MPFGLSFTNPWALILFPPLAAYSYWLARISLADLSTARRRLAVGFRLVILALIVLALSGMQIVRFNRNQATMFVLDYSDSIAPADKDKELEYIHAAANAKGANDQVGIVVFGREAFIELAPSASNKIDKIQTVTPSEFTDLSAAIRLGMASLPDGFQKRLVVISDGNENLGNALDESFGASNNDVKIDVVPLASSQKNEVLLERLTLPGEAKIGEPVEVKVVARSTHDANGKIRLFKDGKLLGTREVRLVPGKNVFNFPQSVEEAGPATFEAQIETDKKDDTVAENNRTMGFLNVHGKPRVLLVTNDPTQGGFLLQALAKEKVNAEMRGDGGMPADLRGMQSYDAIIMDNIPAWELSVKQMLALQSYVRDLGCGLVMVGGENSYGPGGYRSTPIEETLPVSMDIKNMQYIPGGAVAMIMHSCEFPAGNDWAKSVCSQVTRQLGDNDWAGLVVFGMDASWVYNGGMLRVGPNRNYMLTQIRGIDPGDMPDFDAALQVAYKGLIGTKAYLKHCIILSDGDPSPPRPALVQQFKAAKITVSTVVIQPHDPSGAQNMWQIAKLHNGRFYAVRNPKEIPNIFLKEAATVSRSAIIEDPFHPRVSMDSSILKGLDAMPALGGYVATTAKGTAKEVLKTNQDDPLLATWQYGLGKAVAFTSDARQRWSANWLPWPGYSKFWAQAVRWSMRGATGGDLTTNITIDRGKGKVTIEAVDEKGNFLNFLSPKARLVPPDYKGQDLPLDQTGPGRYEANFDARQLGTYLVNIRTQRGETSTSQITGGVLPYSPEYAALEPNQPLLSGIAENTGGDVLDLKDPAKVFSRPRNVAKSPVDIWLSLLMLATVLFPLDVAVRRLMWGEEELAALSSRLRRRPRPKTESKPPAPRSSEMDRLRQAKRGATSTSVEPNRGPAAPPPPAPPGGGEHRGSAPVDTAPPRQETPPPAVQPVPEPSEEDLDPLERLRRAKRRARGE